MFSAAGGAIAAGGSDGLDEARLMRGNCAKYIFAVMLAAIDSACAQSPQGNRMILAKCQRHRVLGG
jgi:hypothetical protein